VFGIYFIYRPFGKGIVPKMSTQQDNPVNIVVRNTEGIPITSSPTDLETMIQEAVASYMSANPMPQGDVGAPGIKGDQGEQGIQGNAGPQGIKGDKGSQGDIGPQGIAGVKGDTGLQGPAGPKGDTGNTGAQGIQGPTGNAGAQGTAGVNSFLDGKTALIPAATLLGIGTRTVNVTWNKTLPNNTYNVVFLTDNTLSIGTPYTYAAINKTTTGFTLQYTNSSILTLGSGVIHCIATP